LRGLAAAIGIIKGKRFVPDQRMTKTLNDAVAVGNATARAVSLTGRDPHNDRLQYQVHSRNADGKLCAVVTQTQLVLEGSA
jgi:hypothetical protein